MITLLVKKQAKLLPAFFLASLTCSSCSDYRNKVRKGIMTSYHIHCLGSETRTSVRNKYHGKLCRAF